MSQKFRTSLIGYSKKAVIMQLEKSKSDGLDLLSEKQRLLNNLIIENQALIHEKNDLFANNAIRNELSSKLEDIIVGGFVENYKELYDLETKINAIVAAKDSAISVQLGKSSDIRKRIEEFTLRIENEINSEE